MRFMTIAGLAAVSLASGLSGAEACGGFDGACPPSIVAWPAYGESGRRIGVVEAQVRHLPRLDVSRYTGQPLTVIYDHPGRVPGAVDPYLRLVTLPSAKRSDTVGAYPVGY